MNRLTVLLVVLALLLGMRIEKWHEGYGTAKAIQSRDNQVAHGNVRTQTRDIAAATRIGAVVAGGQATQDRIQNFKPTASTRGDTSHAPAAATRIAICPGALADPQFRVLWDAGSDPGGATSEAHDVPGATANGPSQLPHP